MVLHFKLPLTLEQSQPCTEQNIGKNVMYPWVFVFFHLAGLAPGGNLSGLELGPMMGGMKDTGGQQSRFKWMMEGHSPAPSPPDSTLHKNGRLTDGL